jgi:uncharacterized membrane protein HdeD (DUF308 family)
MNRPSPSHIDINALERETGFGWSWFVVLGVSLFVLGTLAFLNLPAAGTLSLYAVGIVMLIGAFAQLGTLLLVPSWRGTSLLALTAVLYGAAGILVIANPMLAVKHLTLMLAFALIFSGGMRIGLSGVMPSLPGWGWIVASGLVTAAAGLVFIGWWPADTLRLLGMVLAIDLTVQGAMAIGFGLSLKAITK